MPRPADDLLPTASGCWRSRTFLDVKTLYASDGPFDGLIKKDVAYRLLDQRQIISVRVGGRRLVLCSSVVEFIDRLVEDARRPTAPEAPVQAATVPPATTRRRRAAQRQCLEFQFVPPG
jgi:hypothetical protein